MRPCREMLALVVLVLLPLLAAPAAAQDADLILVLDASGSMWGQIGGENKIVIARRVLADVIAGLDDGARVGLVAYGHRREGDCDDVETVVATGPVDKAALTARIDGLNPKGKTPITRAVGQAFDLARAGGGPATVVLVSDGLETCGGDPCATVRDARAADIDFVMHVVGFDVGEVDVSQLECAAQAGGGLYLDARDADGLADALDRAVAVPADLPAGRLSVTATADGALADAVVRVRTPQGEEVAGGRTYTSAETNPRVVPLADGTYRVTVAPVGIRGAGELEWTVEIAEGATVEKVADFSSGELVVGVTHNGELGDAVVRAVVAGTREEKASGRTYTGAKTNPKTFRLAPGTYDVTVGSVTISGKPEKRFEGVVVEPGGRVVLEHAFASGELRVGAVAGGQLVDAVVGIYDAGGRQVAGGRTYTGEKTNPKSFVLPPGGYRVEVRAVRLEGKPEQQLEVAVEAGGSAEHVVDLGGS